MSELDAAKYLSFTAFEKDGSPVSPPVWISGGAGTYAFSTGGRSWKARRVSDNPSVQVQVFDMRGRVALRAATHTATGEVVGSAVAIGAVARAPAATYGRQFRSLESVDASTSRLGRGDGGDAVAAHLSRDGR